VGRRWRPWRRRDGSATEVSASELDAVIERHVRKAVNEERESIRREAEEEIDRRMDEFTEMMVRRQDKLMARAWQAFNRRARQPRQRAKRSGSS
jgi:hypothetical protein